MGHKTRTGTSSAARAKFRIERGVTSENGVWIDTSDQKRRTCLVCGKTFLSLSRGNRQCARCSGSRVDAIKVVKRVRVQGHGVRDI
jgi:protein-arginine kinase activator protein McsA